MKKLLLIVGVLCIIICVLFLLFAILNMFSYYNVLDGTIDLYNRLHHRMIVSFVIGVILALIGTVCIIVRSKI